MEIVVVLIVLGVIGGLIGASKGAAFAGFFLGLLLGPIGWVIVASSKTPTTLTKIQSAPATAGWHPDPLGRFDSRYWDGKQWTQHVGRVEADGTRRQLEDPH